MPSPADPAAAKPRVRTECPRCGYDLSGVVESWKETCPLEGVCSECGLELEWGRVFAVAAAPAWSCEHSLRFSVWRLLRTAPRILRPSVFWRSIAMELPVVTRRLVTSAAVFVVACFLVLSALGSGVTFGGFTIQHGFNRAQMANYEIVEQTMDAAILFPITAQFNTFGPRKWHEAWYIVCVGLAVSLAPASMAVLPDTRRKFKVRTAHLVRGCAYTMIGVTFVYLLRQVGVLGLSIATEGAGVHVLHPDITRNIPAVGSARVLALLLALWGIIAWASFVVVYLRVKHAWATVALLGILAGLAAGIVWVSPYALFGGTWL